MEEGTRATIQFSKTSRCLSWVEARGSSNLERGVDLAMYTDRSLATLLRALQSESDEQDISR